LPNNWSETIDQLLQDVLNSPKNIATRQSSKIILDVLSKKLPELFGGSADLSHSNLTLHNNALPFDVFQKKKFNYLHYGVREFGMFSIINGMSLHKGFIPYAGTFLVFADYARSALRLSALMQQKVIYVLTHDSIGLGEDGPTHQPIEHLSMLRMTPNVSIWRPCDTVETIIAWQVAIQEESINTSCLVLSRQSVVQQDRTIKMLEHIKLGGYILHDPKNPQAIIIATGSEVELAMQAAKQLAEEVAVRVVSMPNMNIFLQQPDHYQESILPKDIVARVAVEAGNTFIWHKFVGLKGKVIGIDSFGLSAPAEQIYKNFNITVDAVKQAVIEVLNN
jgi:transketolase